MISVTAAAPARFLVTGPGGPVAAGVPFGVTVAAPVTAAPGVPFDVTVYALDPYGNVDVNYQGTVSFATTDGDPNVVLPGPYAFTTDDAGVYTFSGFTLVTPGDQTITATDDGGLGASAIVTVQADGAPGVPGSGGQDYWRGLASESVAVTAGASDAGTPGMVQREAWAAHRARSVSCPEAGRLSRQAGTAGGRWYELWPRWWVGCLPTTW